jgi:hypothetical protein
MLHDEAVRIPGPEFSQGGTRRYRVPLKNPALLPAPLDERLNIAPRLAHHARLDAIPGLSGSMQQLRLLPRRLFKDQEHGGKRLLCPRCVRSPVDQKHGGGAFTVRVIGDQDAALANGNPH